MFRCLMVLALAATLWPGRAEAAELTGFGPIKFGMTKEEAEAALEAAGIEWKWEKDDTRLVYEYPIPDRAYLAISTEDEKFEVKQSFDDGLAIDVTLDLSWPYIPTDFCFDQNLYFVSALLYKYRKSIVIEQDIDTRYVIIDKIKGSIDKSYFIPFEDESFIHISMSSDADKSKKNMCYFWVWYHAPVPNPIPF